MAQQGKEKPGFIEGTAHFGRALAIGGIAVEAVFGFVSGGLVLAALGTHYVYSSEKRRRTGR